MKVGHMKLVAMLVAGTFVLGQCGYAATQNGGYVDRSGSLPGLESDSTVNALLIVAGACAVGAIVYLIVHNSGKDSTTASAQTGSSCPPMVTTHNNTESSGLTPIVDLHAADGNGKMSLVTGLGWTVTF